MCAISGRREGRREGGAVPDQESRAPSCIQKLETVMQSLWIITIGDRLPAPPSPYVYPHVYLSTTVHPRLSDPRLSDTPIVQTQNFTSHTHIYKSHVGRGDCEILQNGVFQSSKQQWSAKNILFIIKGKRDIGKLMAADPIRSATEVDYRLQSQNLWRFTKEMADMHLKIGVQPKLDEHCVFDLGW